MSSKHAVISLSGGMDSSTLLLRLLANGYQVQALSFDYGQKHRCELERATALSLLLKNKGFKVSHKIINLSDISSLLDSALVGDEQVIPTGSYDLDNMKITVVPNRNKIFSSIIQASALSIAQRTGCPVEIAMGIHGGDHAVYPDCRQVFRDADYQAFLLGNWDAEQVSYYTPYINCSKTEVLADGVRVCKELSLDFDTIYSLTFTAYQPIYHDGVAYSDYQSSASLSRIEAFMALGLQDPIQYADSQGLVSWTQVCDYARKNIDKE